MLHAATLDDINTRHGELDREGLMSTDEIERIPAKVPLTATYPCG